MPDDTTSTDDTDDGTVTLVSPDGQEVAVRNPVAVNDLVYGQGYRLKGDDDPQAAVEAAKTTEPPAEQQTEVTAAPSTATGTRPSTTTKSSGRPSGAPSTT